MRHGEHAVVIGASMGGLVAAAAVAPFYDRVTIIERDVLSDGPQHRRGVPQSRHAHGLQPGGLRALEELLPGLTDALIAGGAVVADLAARCEWFVGGGSLARGVSGVPGIGVTRPFLEHTVRARVAQLPGVTVQDATEVLRPLAALDGRGRQHVIGVVVATAGGGAERPLAADLVVDASGRATRLPGWLTDLGWAAPAEETVQCRMAYLTRRWRLTNDVLGDDIVEVVTPGASPHFGVLIRQEDGNCVVTLGGLLGAGPARDDAAYLAFARALPRPRIAEALDGAEPVTDLQPSHFPASRRRRYDRLRAVPAGVIALGDSIASFNPMYGQGMSVAALEAVALRDNLARGPLDARAFLRRAHRIADVAWKIAAGGDLRFDAVEGERGLDQVLMNRYLDRLTTAARTDPALAAQFLRVAGFIDPPEALFKPSVVWRVLRGGRAAARSADHRPAPLREATATAAD